MVHQDRAKSRTPERERERERDQTHSNWYIPSAPRVNYSLHVMGSAGKMKMAAGDGSPLRQDARTGPRLVFGGYRGLQWRNSQSRFLFGGFCIYRNFWRRSHVRGVFESSTRQGRARQGRARPPPSWMARDSSGQLLYFGGFLWSIKIIKNWHVNWTPFGIPFL